MLGVVLSPLRFALDLVAGRRAAPTVSANTAVDPLGETATILGRLVRRIPGRSRS